MDLGGLRWIMQREVDKEDRGGLGGRDKDQTSLHFIMI